MIAGGNKISASNAVYWLFLLMSAAIRIQVSAICSSMMRGAGLIIFFAALRQLVACSRHAFAVSIAA